MRSQRTGKAARRRLGDREDPKREERIVMEAIVDCQPEEQAIGWYYYLQDKMQFPFAAECVKVRSISPLEIGDRVQVVAMAPEEECEHEMFVKIRSERCNLAVPLIQLLPVAETDPTTTEAVEDWHYWIGRGYQL